MPQNPAPVREAPLAFSDGYTIAKWLDSDAQHPNPHETAIATGTFRGVAVTYWIHSEDGRVRAEPDQMHDAGARLKGWKRILFELFSRIGLDMGNRVMRNLWRFDAADSARFESQGFAAMRADRAPARRVAFENAAAVVPQAGHPPPPTESPVVVDDAPLPNVANAAAGDPTPAGAESAAPNEAPTSIVVQPAPVESPAKTEPPVGRPNTALDDVPHPSLQRVFALLQGDGSPMLAVSRQMNRAVAEEHHWTTLQRRAESVTSPAGLLEILDAMHLKPNGKDLPSLGGERTREAAVLAALAQRMQSSCWREHYGDTRNLLLLAIMALPVPARHTPLRLWLQVDSSRRGGKRYPGKAWRGDLYAQFPAAEKAKLCISEVSPACWSRYYNPALLGLDGKNWLTIARELDIADLEQFTGAVLESRRIGIDPVYWEWPVHQAAVEELLQDCTALDPQRRAAVITGILRLDSRILRESSQTEDEGIPRVDMAREGSLWRRLLDAVPASYAFRLLSNLTSLPRREDEKWGRWHGHHDIAATEARRLMERVLSEDPDALTTAQRKELSLRLDRLSGTDIEPSWFVAMAACDDPATSIPDLKRLVNQLRVTLPQIKGDSGWRRMLALCQSTRISPAKQARLLADMEETLPKSSSYFDCEERFELAFKIAERGGPTEAIVAMALALPQQGFERALDLMAGRSGKEVHALLRHLIRYDGPDAVRAKAMFERRPLVQRIEWVETEHVRDTFLFDLLDIEKAGGLEPALVQRLFHAVSAYCIGYALNPTAMAGQLLTFVTPLRDMIVRNSVLHGDPAAWANLLQMIGRAERHAAAPAEAIAQARKATLDLLRVHAPGLEPQVSLALRAQQAEHGW